jgi:hypothetical protein
MKDKSLGIWMTVLFGIPGIAVLMLAWLWPVLETERNMAIFVGSAGLLSALVQVWLLRRSTMKVDDKMPVKVEVENK